MGWQKNMKLISLCIYLFLQREPKQRQEKNNNNNNKKQKNKTKQNKKTTKANTSMLEKKTQNCRKRSKTMDYSKLLYIAKNWRDLFAAV